MNLGKGEGMLLPHLKHRGQGCQQTFIMPILLSTPRTKNNQTQKMSIEKFAYTLSYTFKTVARAGGVVTL